jgi:enediyne biosynthesis protein E4
MRSQPKFARVAAFLAAGMLGALIGCSRDAPVLPVPEPADAPDGPAWFEDITERAGLNFAHHAGDLSKFYMYQCVGSGCAISDLDGDGRPDLILLTNAGPKSTSTNKLYRQLPNETFEDASAGSGLDFPGLNMGIAIGDINNDGKPDVVVTQVNGARLLLNQGGMKFADVTMEAGLSNPMWGASAAFVDYDRDGWLDLLIVNYVDYDSSWPCLASTGVKDYCSPKVFHGTASKLFRNRGGAAASQADPKKPRARFDDVTALSRIGDKTGPGLGVAVFDCDGDGWPDLFVANDGQPNYLWINKRDGTFAEEAVLRGVASTMTGLNFAGMGVALGDSDNDGLLDLYVTHLTSETNTLWKQGPKGWFRDVSADSNLTASRWRGTGFGTLMADFDNDGNLDLVVTNGRVSRGPTAEHKLGLEPHWQPYGERNQVFANLGGGKYRDISHNNPALCGYFTVGRGLACGDVDGDGAPDLLLNAAGGKARLLRNVAPKAGHWLTVRAIDPNRKREAVGAEITVTAGGVRRTRLVQSSDSFLSAGTAAAQFGLGSATAVAACEVRWPDGAREVFPGGSVDRTIELRKGSGVMK